MIKRFAFVLSIFSMLVVSQALANPIEILGTAEAEHPGRFTLAPGGGEDLQDPAAGNEYRINVRIWDSYGDPLIGVPETEFTFTHPALVTCPWPWSQADAPTDENGETTMSGTILGGLAGDAHDGIDCEQTLLYVWAMGFPMNDGDPVAVSFDSPDLNGDLSVSIPDFALYVQDFNCANSGELCDPCHDYSEDGNNDVADFAIFASYFNTSSCP